MMHTLQDYINACSFPGRLDDAAVEDALRAYLAALGVTKTVRRLPRCWTMDDHPAIQRNVDFIVDKMMDAMGATDATDAMDATGAMDARVATDAMDAPIASHRLACWDILSGGWWGYWDVSLIATTAIGARQTKEKTVSAWSEPLLDAYVSGCWYLYWTDDTLYWIAKPTLHMDETSTSRRVHKTDGPAFVCDVEDLYFWRGTMIPAEWITDKSSLDAKTALTWPNMEQRRIACSDIVGWTRILAELDATIIDADSDPQIGTLVEVSLPDLPTRAKFLRVTCGTGREFAVGIHPSVTTAIGAQAWIQGVELKNFKRPEIRT